MFNNYKKGIALLATGIVTTMAGCQKEEEPLDLEVPSVSLEISGNPEKLYNEVSLSATATDNGTIARVVFYVNSDSLGQDTEAPFEIQWNTKETEDGPYMLKAIAYDAANNAAEAAQDITVKNTLFEINVEDGYFEFDENGKEEQWAFLSDEDGNVIGDPKQIQNGSSLLWERPSDFYSDTVYLNRLYSYHWSPQSVQRPSTYITLYTYTNFNLDVISMNANGPAELHGQAEVYIENDFNGIDEYKYSTAFPSYTSSLYSNKNSINYSVKMYADNQKGFSTYEKDEFGMDPSLREKYYRIDDFQVGGSSSFHSNDYTPMEGQMVSFPFETSYASLRTTGYLNTEQQWGYNLDRVYSFDNQTQDFKVFSTDAFPYIRTNISGRTGNKTFYIGKMGKAPEVVSLPDFSVSITTADMKNIEVSTSGSLDIASAFWSYTEESDTHYLTARRAIYCSSESGAKYVLPEIPASLLELYPALSNPMEYSWAYGNDNKAFSSYSDILKYWFTNTYSGFEYQEYSSQYIYPDNTGARILPTQNGKKSQKEMEEEDLRARGIFRN